MEMEMMKMEMKIRLYSENLLSYSVKTLPLVIGRQLIFATTIKLNALIAVLLITLDPRSSGYFALFYETFMWGKKFSKLSLHNIILAISLTAELEYLLYIE
jgi:hypothetical protein